MLTQFIAILSNKVALLIQLSINMWNVGFHIHIIGLILCYAKAT